MSRKHYIEHEDVQTPENGTAYFGPFEESEMDERLNDAYADLLAGSGNVDGVVLTDAEAEAIGYINPRVYWMDQLAVIKRSPIACVHCGTTHYQVAAWRVSLDAHAWALVAPDHPKLTVCCWL